MKEKENLLTRIFGSGNKKAAEACGLTLQGVPMRSKPEALVRADFQPDYSKPEWRGFEASDMASRQSTRSGYTWAMREVAEIYRIAYPLLDNGEIGKAKQVLAEAFRWVPDAYLRKTALEEFTPKGGSR